MACSRLQGPVWRNLMKPQILTACYTQAAGGQTSTQAGQQTPPPTSGDDNKSYQAQQYFEYNEFSFYDMERAMVAKRETQPQPDANAPLIPDPPPPKK